MEGREISIKADFQEKLGFFLSDKAHDVVCLNEAVSRKVFYNHYVRRGECEEELIHNEKIKRRGIYSRWVSWGVT